MLYLSESGLIYGGDRQLRADGSFDPEIPDRPSPQHQWSGTAWELELAPDWGIFRAAMMSDSMYQKIVVGIMGQAQGNWLVTTLQDVISMPSPSLPLFQPLWNQVLSLSLHQPLPLDIDRWNGYADSNRVGIKFQANGTIGQK